MNVNKRLVLGIGNRCKKILQSLEPAFKEVKLAVLDGWCKVQEIVIEDEIKQKDFDLKIIYRTNLSYFVEPPLIALRFDARKYDDVNISQVIPYPPEQIKLFEDQLVQRFKPVLSGLLESEDIVVLCNDTDSIALVWLLPLVKHLTPGRHVRIFSICYQFSGPEVDSRAQGYFTDLLGTGAKLYSCSLKEIRKTHGNLPVTKALEELEKRQLQAVEQLLGNKFVDD